MSGKAYSWKRKSRVRCARGSMRTLNVGKGSKRRALRICCPRGPKHWVRGRCRVGTRVYEVGTPKR